MTPMFHAAAVSNDELKEIQALEGDLGKVLVALDSKPVYADLNAEQLARLQATEKKLGMVILAYENS